MGYSRANNLAPAPLSSPLCQPFGQRESGRGASARQPADVSRRSLCLGLFETFDSLCVPEQPCTVRFLIFICVATLGDPRLWGAIQRPSDLVPQSMTLPRPCAPFPWTALPFPIRSCASFPLHRLSNVPRFRVRVTRHARACPHQAPCTRMLSELLAYLSWRTLLSLPCILKCRRGYRQPPKVTFVLCKH